MNDNDIRRTHIGSSRSVRRWLAIVVLALLSFGMPDAAWAQAGATGTISGTVTDGSGGVLPGATVVVTNTETSISRTLQVDHEGRYSASNLPPGPYEVTASMDGFVTVARSGMRLTIGREAIVDFGLKVGGVTDRVEVVGEAPIIQTTTASTGGLISQEQISNLPLNGRSYIELATLTPGAILSATGGQGAGTGFGAKLSVNGSRYQQNLFTIDGTTMNDQYNQAGGVSGNVLGVEAIREFQVLTNSFSAEYGRIPAASSAPSRNPALTASEDRYSSSTGTMRSMRGTSLTSLPPDSPRSRVISSAGLRADRS